MRFHQFDQISNRAGRPCIRFGRLTLCIALFLAMTATTAHADLASAIQELIDTYGGIRNDKTPAGVTDGNPQAATAFMAGSTYSHYGLAPRLNNGPRFYDDDGLTFGVNVTGATIDSGRVNGYYVAGDIEIAGQLSETVALSLLLPMQYRNLNGTDTYVGGAEFGLPITLIQDHGEGFFWMLTPSLMLTSVGASEQLAQGGYLFGGAVTSSLSWRLGSLTLIMANQAGYDWGEPLSYTKDYNLETGISQIVLKNGVRAAYAFKHNLAGDIGITYSNLVNDAYVDAWWTPTAGITFSLGDRTGIRIGFTGDYADNYQTYGGELQFFTAF